MLIIYKTGRASKSLVWFWGVTGMIKHIFYLVWFSLPIGQYCCMYKPAKNIYDQLGIIWHSTYLSSQFDVIMTDPSTFKIFQ